MESKIFVEKNINQNLQKNGKLAIVPGATGKTGYYVVQRLIQKGYAVRIITRSYNSAKKIFGETLEQMEEPIICDLVVEAKKFEKQIDDNTFKPQESILNDCFKLGKNGEKPSLVLLCQTRNLTMKEKTKYVEFTASQILVQLAKIHNIEKVGLISAAHTTKPYNFAPLLLNNMVDNVMYWKCRIENYIRQSGLDYVIIRPVGLDGELNNSFLQQLTMEQGDSQPQLVFVQRSSVGYNFVDVLDDKNIPKKCTYEVVSKKHQKKQQYEYIPIQLKSDGKDSIIDCEKQLIAKNRVNKCIFTTFGFLILGTAFLLLNKYQFKLF